MKVLIVPDKFKGTLSAGQAAEAIARGWRMARPADELDLLPMSDGGDGFGEMMSLLMGAVPNTARTIDAAHRPCDAVWWWHEASGTAIVESARVIGLAQLPPGKFHPFELDTEGLGVLLKTVATQGASRCLVGVGGSATNDAGFGMARALGWIFLNRQGEKIERWTELHQLSQIHRPEPAASFGELVVAVDVQNPLLGPEGCTRIYGPQKGLRPDDFDFAERCLEQLVDVLQKQMRIGVANEPGSGAAGGLGFGLCSFAGARLSAGFELFAEQSRLRERLKNAELVITAEGAIDRQTLMGKGVGQIARLAKELGVDCIGMAGVIEERNEAEKHFRVTCALTDLTNPEEAMQNAAVWLDRLATHTANRFTLTRK
jgi:glycerate kinase